MKKLIALLLSLLMLGTFAMADESAPIMDFSVAMDAIPDGYLLDERKEGDVAYLVFTPEDETMPSYYVSVAFSELFSGDEGGYTLNNLALTDEEKANVEAILGMEFAAPQFDYSRKTLHGTDVIIVNETAADGCDYADIMSVYQGYMATVSILSPSRELTGEDIERGIAIMSDLWIVDPEAVRVPDSTADMWEISGAVLTVHVPEGWQFESNGQVELDTLAQGEVMNGINSVSFLVPVEKLTAEPQLAELFCYNPDSDDALILDFNVDAQGNLTPSGLTLTGEGYSLTWGPFADDGSNLLFVEIAGNPTTGYEWTFTPDNSGILEVVSEEYNEDDFAGDMVGVGGTYVWVFQPAADYAGQTTLLFNHGRSWEDKPIATLCITVTMDENRVVTDLSPLYLAY